ncbi:MAG: hypothetical protein KBT04_08065 [Bacteroidales bacterium]|nr:hypothetical protein [Candidatus Colimorpha onthohippi]
MKKLLSLFLAVLTIGLLGSCSKEESESEPDLTPAPKTMTMAEILATNPDIPEVDNAVSPSNAWINQANPDYTAFIGIVDETRVYILGSATCYFGIYMSDVFENVDNNTYSGSWEGYGTIIVHLTEGKFTSFDYQPEPGCKYESIAGTYAASTVSDDFVYLGVKNAAGKPLYWSKMNLGATCAWGYGDYYAWGETAPYYEGIGGWPETPTWKTGKNSGYSWYSYCGEEDFAEWTTKPYDETTGILLPAYDAATIANASWRTPTANELQDLLDSCYWEWADDYNSSAVKGYIVYKAKNDEDKGQFDGKTGYTTSDPHIFLPVAGNIMDTERDGDNRDLVYWSSTVNAETPSEAKLLLYGMGISIHSLDRYRGLSIRPVTD